MGNSLDSYKSMDYNKIKDTLKTGDLMMFSGHGGISNFIKCVTFSPWSHVGIILKIHDSSRFKITSPDDLYLLHSYNKEFEIDVISGEMKSGVQLNVLKDAITTYINEGGRAFVRKAPSKYDFDKSVTEDKFMDWLVLTSPKKYEESYHDLASSQIDCLCLPCFNNTGDNSSYFCSELVRDVLEELGNEKFKKRFGEYSDEYTPADLSSSAYCFFCEPKINLSKLGWGEEIEVEIKVNIDFESKRRNKSVNYKSTRASITKSEISPTVTVYFKLTNKD